MGVQPVVTPVVHQVVYKAKFPDKMGDYVFREILTEYVKRILTVGLGDLPVRLGTYIARETDRNRHRIREADPRVSKPSPVHGVSIQVLAHVGLSIQGDLNLRRYHWRAHSPGFQL